MRHSLQSHLLHLEITVQSLRDRLTASLTPGERKSLGELLLAAELALDRYREAYVLELSVSVPEPSGDTGSGSGAVGKEGYSGPRRKKDTGSEGHMWRSRRARLHCPSVRFFATSASARN